jgi:hypothetical protein
LPKMTSLAASNAPGYFLLEPANSMSYYHK